MAILLEGVVIHYLVLARCFPPRLAPQARARQQGLAVPGRFRENGAAIIGRKPMDQATYSRWWKLHLQTARGETLSAQDEAFYKAGRKALEDQELLKDGLAEIQAAHARVTSLAAEHNNLEAKRKSLDAEIAVLEAALS